jgi:hypothetical protein
LLRSRFAVKTHFEEGPSRAEGLTLFSGEVAFLLFFASFRETGADISTLWIAACSLEVSPVDFFSACRAFRRFS